MDNKVLVFGAWLIKQSRVRKANRGMEEPLASYFKNYNGSDNIEQMDIAAFAEFLKGWAYFYGAFDAAAYEYLKYVKSSIVNS